MEGVTISVRGQNEPYVTTVFTNQRGVFVFPPPGNTNQVQPVGPGRGISDCQGAGSPR